jgi:glycine/D-amino acid oxidase-like deaminating enzyme
MAALRLARSLWLDRAGRFRAAPAFPRLRGACDTDIVVVGGGITGAAIAWRFAAAGRRVVVLEAGRVARGSTAASTALLMQEPDEDFADLARRYGGERSRRIWELSREATRGFVDTIRQLRIAADLRPRDSIYYTLRPELEGTLRREYDSRRRAGIDGRWLSPEALRRAAGFRGVAAIRTTGNAEADPYQAALGLLSAAVRRGALVFERSAALRVDADRGGVRVRLRRGSVHASHVVVATGYATPQFEPLLGRFRMWNTYVVATEPLEPRARREVGLGRVMLWDTDRPYHYARWSPDDRLILGGGDRPMVTGRQRLRAFREGTAAVVDHFSRLYPALADVRFAYAWEGLFATTPDGLPYIGTHRRYPRHLFALGYGGNGMTFGFLASRLLLELVEGRPSADHELFAFGRLRERRALS